MSMSVSVIFNPKNHDFRARTPSDARSPCPALNALANHGYISRTGSDLTFFEIVNAIVLVYNLSYSLACLLAFGGFISCGRISFSKSIELRLTPDDFRKGNYAQFLALPLVYFLKVLLLFFPCVLLDLSSLSRRGTFKIAHDASFVHPNGSPATSPCPILVERLLQYASTRLNSQGKHRDGLSLIDIAQFHVERVLSTDNPLGKFHTEIALGECALAWEVLSGPQSHGRTDATHKSDRELVIPTSRLEQWYGEERLPDSWWDVGGARPIQSIGMVQTRTTAKFIGTFAQRDGYTRF